MFAGFSPSFHCSIIVRFGNVAARFSRSKIDLLNKIVLIGCLRDLSRQICKPKVILIQPPLKFQCVCPCFSIYSLWFLIIRLIWFRFHIFYNVKVFAEARSQLAKVCAKKCINCDKLKSHQNSLNFQWSQIKCYICSFVDHLQLKMCAKKICSFSRFSIM